MKVTYFQRKAIPNFHFSVEIIFSDVRKYLPDSVRYTIETSKYYSQGIFPRIYNVLEAFFRQEGVNHVTGDINYIGLLLSKKRTIQTILDCVYMQRNSGLKMWVYKIFWVTLPVNRCKFVTTISEASKAEIVMFSRCDPDKVKVIPIALSPVFLPVERSYQWSKPRMLMIGSAHNKNQVRMIRALEGIDCRIQIVGQFEQEIKDLLDALKMDYVYQSGFSIDQMYKAYQETDILMFASTYEGFGMPLIEAQATGVIPVTSNISSMPEVAGEGGAVFVDPYDVQSIRQGVLNAIHDQQLRASIHKKGFENVKRFEPRRISEMYVDLYKQI
jgi:glycosyltransferase involved in cell wall biosynthesis